MKIKLNSIYKPKILFKGRVFKCQIGKNGKVPKYKKKEGDRSTPIGKWKIQTIHVRKEEIFKLTFKKYLRKRVIYIQNNHIWCDDVSSKFYNKLVKTKNINKINYSFEKMFRNDNAYDIVIEIDHNQKPIIKNKGSAIFIHCSFDDLRPTHGCVAIRKNTLKFLINNLQNKNYIYID